VIEAEAQRWLADRVSRETFGQLGELAEHVRAEMPRQNLIAASTAEHIWARHIVDSAQLAAFAPETTRSWLDLGSGAGFPGLVIALVRPELHVTLVESRRKRAEFLGATADALGVSDRVEVRGQRLELIGESTFDAISARAFAPLGRLLSLAHRFSHERTIWLLPKGRSAVSELEAVDGSWQGDFQVVPSVTDSDAAIIVAREVQPQGKGLKGR